jgi:hypothetical protein
MTGAGITYNSIKDEYAKHGYPFLTDKYQPNYFGIRSKDNTVDDFNDIIGVAWCDAFLNPHTVVFRGTTKPGLVYLKDKLGNYKGTFIVAEGFHKSCWIPGFHNGKYPALVQAGPGVFRGYRDFDADGQLDYSGTIYTDSHGVNGHTTRFDTNVEKVGAFSAGCFVLQDDKEHAIWYNVGARSWEFYGKAFSLAVFKEK